MVGTMDRKAAWDGFRIPVLAHLVNEQHTLLEKVV